MPKKLTPQTLRNYLSRLGEGTRGATTLVLTGSGALALLPSGFVSDAHTFCGTPEYGEGDPMRAAELNREFGLTGTTGLPYDKLPPLRGARQRRVKVGEFGGITAWLEDPSTTALALLVRGRDQDLRLAGRLLDAGHVEITAMRQGAEALAKAGQSKALKHLTALIG